MYFCRIRTAFLLAHWEKKKTDSVTRLNFKKYVFEALMLWVEVLGGICPGHPSTGLWKLCALSMAGRQGGKWPVGPGNFP